MNGLFKSKLFWLISIPLLLIGLYALLGFKVAPGIVRDQAQKFVRENYGRELAIGEIRIHPFKLQVEARDVALPDADGRPMLGFARLFADFELASIWNRAFTFREVAIEAPEVRAVVRRDGSFNLADLALPEDPAEPDEPMPKVWIQRLDVARGILAFTDRARSRPFAHVFRDVTFALEDFRTTPEGGDFRLNARSQEDETFDWKGRFALEPVISSQGEFRIGALRTSKLLDFLGDARPFTSNTGMMDLAGSYRVALAEPAELDVQLPKIEIRDLGLLARGADAPWVKIPSVVVSGVRAAMLAQTLSVEKVVVDSLTAQAWMDPDRSINIERLFSAPAEIENPAAADPDESAVSSPARPDASATASDATAPDRPWTVAVGGIEVINAAIDFEDRAIAPVTKFRIAPVNVRMSDASLDLSKPFPVSLDALINDHARFDVKGTVTPDPLAADLDIRLSRARMTILQPYVLPLADLTITGGELGVEGKARLAPPERDGPELNFKGDVVIDGFKSVDNAGKEDLVSWVRLDLRKVDYAMAPDSLRMDQVLVKQLYARVIITPEQMLNIAQVLDPEGAAKAVAEKRAEEAAEAARSPAEKRRLERERKAAEKAAARQKKADEQAGRAVAAPRPAVAPPDEFPIRVREVRIDAGRMNFTDNFIQPNFSADVQQLQGTIVGLSTAWDARAKVELKGNLGEFSPVSISGELQPFDFERYSDLEMRFENISLPILNPYSGSLAGYNIAKGKLTTDLHYIIQDKQLDAQHKIRIDQLEWGEATANKGEATLPVKFATSLLKDRNGVINLDVPVGGTIDDPTFRIGPIVWQVIKNIIIKAVTAPFALLGGLFAGAEEAQFVDFAPGESALDGATAERLSALGKSLVEKPELKLDVPIGAISEIDGQALTERAYRAALESAAAARAKKGAAAPAYESLTPEQKIEALTALVRTQSGVAPAIPEPPPVPDEASRKEAQAAREAAAVDYLEKAVRAGVTVPEAEMARLAEDRAAAIERALLNETGLEAQRVFKMREGKISANDGKVRVELGLE
jgi:uncharacterized protein involved in outer membrane biogenesis